MWGAEPPPLLSVPVISTPPTAPSFQHFTFAPWDPNGFHRGPTPTPSGGQSGPGHPHCSPPLKPPCFFRLCVSPASSLPLLSAASLLLVPLSTQQPSFSTRLTNLS